MDSAEFRGRDPSWAAFTTLERLIAPFGRKGAAAELRREVETERLGYSSDSFVPFLQERGKLGKLIRRQVTREYAPQGESTVLFDPQAECSDNSFSNQLTQRLPRLGKVVQKVSVPAVGTYTHPSSFLKHSFSVRRTKPVFPPPPKKQAKPIPVLRVSHQKLVPIYQYTVKKREKCLRQSDKYDILKPEVLAERTRRTNFQLVKLDDTPEEISSSVQIIERRKLKDEHLASAKRIMQKLLKSRFV